MTIDAMGCQKEISAAVRAQQADYVLAVKENQPHLYEDVERLFAKALEEETLVSNVGLSCPPREKPRP